MKEKEVLMFIAHGFEDTEAISTLDLLRRAGINTKTVSITDSYSVISAHELEIKTDYVFKDINKDNCSMIILPGGLPGATNLLNYEPLIKFIKKFNEQGLPISAICAAPMILGSNGILKGKKATCYPGFEQYLEGATIMNERVIKDGNIITANGIGSVFQFSQMIMEQFVGKEATTSVLKKAMYL